jgi:hypothetical protein
MSSRPALSEASLPRMLVVLDDVAASRQTTLDVFDVLGSVDSPDGIIRVRSAFLFEVGEELSVRIEQDGQVTDAIVRVRAHLPNGADDTRITELEFAERGEPREAG